MAESLFTTQTPAGVNNSDGTPGISVGTSVMFAVAGQVTGIRFFSTTTVGGTYTAALYQVTSDDDTSAGTGTLLASKVLAPAPTAGAWNVVAFDSPVSVSTGVLYRAVIHNSQGRYVNTASFFTTDLTNGNITAPQSGSDPAGLGTLRNGTFEINAGLAYPTDEFNRSCYFADVVFEVAGSGTTLPATASGASTSGGTAAASLLSGPQTWQLTASGASASAGSAAVTLTLTAAGSATAASSGTATVALVLAALASAAATSAGAALASIVGESIKATSTAAVTAGARSNPSAAARYSSSPEVSHG